MKFIQWEIILVLFIITFYVVNGDSENKGDNKGEKSKNNKTKCKNQNRGKRKSRDKGSDENDCDDSEDNSSANISATLPEKFVGMTDAGDNDNEFPTSTVSSDAEYDMIAAHIEPVTNDYEDKEFSNSSIITMYTSTTLKRSVNIHPTTTKSSREATKRKINKIDDDTKAPGSGRPADCKICRHTPTTTNKPTKGRTTFTFVHPSGNHNDNTNTNNKKSNFILDKPRQGNRSRGCFANEHNYWFGIYLSNGINMFYRPVNYFRAGQNYWYGLYLPNRQTPLPNYKYLVCNQLLVTQEPGSLTAKNQGGKRVLS